MMSRNEITECIHKMQNHAIKSLRTEEKHLRWINKHQYPDNSTWYKRLFNFFFSTSRPLPYQQWREETEKNIRVYKNRCDRWLSVDENQDDETLILELHAMYVELLKEIAQPPPRNIVHAQQ